MMIRFIITKKVPIVTLDEIEKHIKDNLEHLKSPQTFTTKDGMKANIIPEQKLNHKVQSVITKKGIDLKHPKGKTKYQDYASMN